MTGSPWADATAGTASVAATAKARTVFKAHHRSRCTVDSSMNSTHLDASLRWDGSRLTIVDQTLLPHREQWLTLDGAADTADAIRRLAVRGAPLIGMAAAYGLAMEVTRRPGLGVLEDGAEL